jgi:aryl-alcohol dehydrogenase-like predicted oxidoreductase
MALRPGPYRVLEREDVWNALERFRGWADARGLTATEAAYGWVLADPRVTAVLIGPRTPEQVAAAVAAAETTFDEPERRELQELFAPVAA